MRLSLFSVFTKRSLMTMRGSRCFMWPRPLTPSGRKSASIGTIDFVAENVLVEILAENAAADFAFSLSHSRSLSLTLVRICPTDRYNDSCAHDLPNPAFAHRTVPALVMSLCLRRSRGRENPSLKHRSSFRTQGPIGVGYRIHCPIHSCCLR
jgi:hypothetical protein